MSISDPAVDMRQILEEIPGEYDERVDQIVADLNDYLYFGDKHFRGNPTELVEVDGRQVIAREICNPSWQWRHFKDSGEFYGTCAEDTTAENMFAKSIGVASFYGFIFAEDPEEGGIYTHTILHYYNPDDAMLKMPPCQAYFYETTGHPGSPPVSHDGCIPIPWQGLRRESGFHRFLERGNGVQHTAFAHGFPVGYIFRDHFGE